MPTRNVVLTAHHESLIEALVSAGRYQNASEVLREGLRLVEAREAHDAAKLKALQALAETGLPTSIRDAITICKMTSWRISSRVSDGSPGSLSVPLVHRLCRPTGFGGSRGAGHLRSDGCLAWVPMSWFRCCSVPWSLTVTPSSRYEGREQAWCIERRAR